MDKQKNIVKITCKIKDCVLSGYTTIGKIADVVRDLNNTETIPIFETPDISNSVALFNVSIDKITHIDDKPINIVQADGIVYIRRKIKEKKGIYNYGMDRS